MSGSFQEAREGLRDLRKKLVVIEEIMGSLEVAARSIANRGLVPELSYDREVGELVLRVVVGEVPPPVQVTIGGQPLGAFMAPSRAEGTAPELVTPAWKPSLGDLSDAAQGLDVPPPPARPVETIKLPPAFAPAEDVQTAHTPAPRPAHKTGEWTAEEERRLLEMHDAGQLLPDMVGALNRKGPGIAAKLRFLLAKRDAPTPRPVPAPAPEAPPPPRPAACPPAAGQVPPPARPRLEREAEARLAEVQDPDWPPARDLDLLERMMRGEGTILAARATGADRAEVLARWRSLFPDEPTIEKQAAMLAVVRRKVAG